MIPIFFKRIAIKHFSFVYDKYPEIFKPLELTLVKSGIALSVKNYASVVIFATLIAYIASLITLTSLIAFSIIKMNIFLLILSIIFIPVLIAVMTFIFGIFYPTQRVAHRKKDIETNLPFAIAHMGSVAASGIPPSVIFKMLAKFKEYGVLADEFGKIVRNMETFGMDPMTAMREVSKRTPSEKFRQLLLGFVSTIEGGGDLKLYLKNAGEQALFTWRIKRQKYIQQLSAYAEFYTGILIAAPLFIIALFSVMNMIQPQLGGFGILDLMKMSIYLLVPIVNIGFVIFLEITQVEM
ncbi:MAG: type II secretion system F family protein [Candidatus Aenigmarchaeota archaeon]|nr:type II secretion system F family protein [Candidatus Aenigmarchaeota archaeon]